MDRLDHPAPMRIGLLGSYGGLNVGDEAILASVLAGLRELRPQAHLVVFSRDAQHTRQHHDTDEVLPWELSDRREVLARIAALDLLVLGGGGLLYDGEARRYLRLVSAAHDAGVPVFVHAIGAGPLFDPVDRAIAREVLEPVAELVVRDQDSKRVLEDAGVIREIVVAADPALLLEPADFPRERLDREGVPRDVRLVGVSVREPGRAAQHLDEEGYHALLAIVADFLTHRLNAHVVFVPMERDDIRHAHAVLSRMADPVRGRVLHGLYPPREMLGLMSHLDLVVGMRLHLVMFAAMAGVPFLPLPYAGKVFDFAGAVGAPQLRGVFREEAGPLLSEIDRLWDERPVRVGRISRKLAVLADRARETRVRLGRLLDEIEARAPTTRLDLEQAGVSREVL